MYTNNTQPNRAKREALFPPSIRTVMALAVLLLHTLSTSAQTVIGGLTAPDESAILDIRSTEQGVLFPRLSESERDAVESPASGLMIFNTTSICLEMNAGTPESPSWVEVICRVAQVASLSCDDASLSGVLLSGEEVSDASVSIPYTGGNGGPYSAQSIASGGLAGLTANLAAGTVAEGDSSLTLTLSGSFMGSGVASFQLEIGGQSCQVDLNLPNVVPNSCDPSSPTLIVDVTNPVTGKTWMDRNLGASRAATSSTDAEAAGSLFQWGRFSEGHQCRNSATTTTIATTATPNLGNTWDGKKINTGSPYNWLSPQSTNLWQGVDGVNNPCPTGYRLPTKAEWEAEIASWSSSNTAGAYGSPLKLVTTGIRDAFTANIFNPTEQGWYWSSSTNGEDRMYRLDILQGEVTLFNSATGMAVRCIKD